MRTPTILLAALLILSLGCDKKDAPEPDRSPNRPSVPATPVEPESATYPELTREGVESTLETWLDAQNEGDFVSYMDTYAPSMIGINRAQEQRIEYNRAGWEKERSRIFEREMAVEISNIEIRVGETVAVIDFEQTSTSGSFKDTGPRRLVLESTQAGPRIIREEILAPTRLKDGAENEDADDFTAMKVGQVIFDRYFVVETEVDDSWAKGRARQAEGILAYKAVRYQALPDRLRRYQRLSVLAFTASNTTCERTVSHLRLIARAQIPRGEKELVIQDDAKRGVETLYEMAGREGVVLAAEFNEPCLGAVAATARQSERFEVREAEPVDEIDEAIRLAFRSLGLWQKLQEDFESRGGTGFWDGGLVGYRFRTERVMYFVVEAEAGAGCGEFRGELFAVFRLNGEEPIALTPEGMPGVFRPLIALSFLDEKAAILISRKKMVGKIGSEWEVIQDLTPPSYVCPC